MALPSIVLLLAFVGGIFGFVLGWAGFALADLQQGAGSGAVPPGLALAGAAAVAAAAAHWWRFRVPITLAAGAAGVAAVAIGIVAGWAGPALLLPTMLLVGLASLRWRCGMTWQIGRV
jgi:hypothetical protein